MVRQYFGGSTFDLNTKVRQPRMRNASLQQLTTGSMTRVNRGVDLDLSSTNRNIVLGSGLFDTANGASVEISLGGKTTIYQPGAQVTAAEYVAVKQALSGGQQIQIDRSGRATGGSVDLGSLTSGNAVMKASNLVVPEDVTTYGDFGKGSDFRLNGELSNYGTVQVMSTERAVRGGTIRANDILNHSGASISSTVDLRLEADRNLSNYGDIQSTGRLELVAGQELTNTGRISSQSDLTLGATVVTNRGAIDSSAGNVNFTSPGDLFGQ